MVCPVAIFAHCFLNRHAAAARSDTDFFNRTSIERVVQTVLPSVPYPIMNFQTMEEARVWLMTGELELV